jgi:hypothetical protein
MGVDPKVHVNGGFAALGGFERGAEAGFGGHGQKGEVGRVIRKSSKAGLTAGLRLLSHALSHSPA